ncbi:MAG TPA: RNB domain-containing ribonuclease, partial [Blastocatellia bacterium]|nr:RNB domain-containing ribonuclease [Blastocatellia bacterium]
EEAETLAAQGLHRDDIRYESLEQLPFVTIDPPESRDLDQAFHAIKLTDGYEVNYAIDDVGYFVPYGSRVELEAWQRGLTLYSPDIRTPLYPPIISEEAASLLPDQLRPAIVFSFKLNTDGVVEDCQIIRAFIRSRAKLSYFEVDEHLTQEREKPGSGSLNGYEWTSSLDCLEEIGRRREQLEIERGGVSLRIPPQQVERWSTALTGYRLAFEQSSRVEEWNAQISLMTGMTAAKIMLTHGIGLLRALDPPRSDRLRAYRLTALALGVTWPEGMSYSEFIRSLNPTVPIHAVLLHRAAKVTGGARYVAFEETLPQNYRHSAIAAPYAHVTAPLRRLADRYVLDLIVALTHNEPVSSELIDVLYRLPQVMENADRLAKQLESRIVDFAEAHFLQDSVGEVFTGVVIELRPDGGIIQITDPPVRTFITAQNLNGDDPVVAALSEDGTVMRLNNDQVSLGQTLKIKLKSVDLDASRVNFCRVNEGIDQ